MLLKFDSQLPNPAIALPKSTNEAEMSTHLQSEHVEERLSRRGVVQALAAGAAAEQRALRANKRSDVNFCALNDHREMADA